MNKIRLDNLKDTINGDWDIFICSASFESRCLAIPKIIKDIAFNSVFVCHNDNHINNVENTFEALKLFEGKATEVKLNSSDPLITADNFIEAIKNINNLNAKILIDITTFTHEALLIILKIVIDNFDEKNITLLYVNASAYSINEDNYEKKWLSQGIGKIRSVLGYTGYSDPLIRNHLIILFGFESERTKALIDNIEANVVSLGFGPTEESILDEHSILNLKRHKELLEIYPNSNIFEFSPKDPIKTKKAILELVNKYPGYNSIIATMNTKISTIGACLATYENHSIQICYVPALQYNTTGYSKVGDDCYLVNLESLFHKND